ncbi:MAG TPA: response regulator [Verrucomicrobiae bacterium]|jgi:DNA-binding NtrC family response regulator
MKSSIILIIEDDDLQFAIYEEVLAQYKLVRVKKGSAALAEIKRQRPDLLILDHILAEGELGLRFLPQFKELIPFVPVIIISGALEIQQQLKALQGPRRAHYCLPKPLDIHELKQTVIVALSECGQHETVRQFEALERSNRVDSLELLSRSTDRLSRQNRILSLIADSKDRPNVSVLARQLGVARRTIARDIRELVRRGQLDPSVFPDWDSPQSG